MQPTFVSLAWDRKGKVTRRDSLGPPDGAHRTALSQGRPGHQTTKGSTWHFGMKVHVGTDPHGIVHA